MERIIDFPDAVNDVSSQRVSGIWDEKKKKAVKREDAGEADASRDPRKTYERNRLARDLMARPRKRVPET